MTRNADSVKTPLDEKMVDPYSIAGVVYVELIEPGIVTVNEADNEVTVIFKLDTELQQPGTLRVTLCFFLTFILTSGYFLANFDVLGCIAAECCKSITNSLRRRFTTPNLSTLHAEHRDVEGVCS